MKNQGFTLIEVILSIAFLSLVSVVILQLFITSQNINSDAQMKDMASFVATNAIEETKASRDLVEGQVTTYFDEAWQPVDGKEASTYTMLVSVDKDPLYPNLYSIQVAITTKDKEVLITYHTKHHLKREVS